MILLLLLALSLFFLQITPAVIRRRANKKRKILKKLAQSKAEREAYNHLVERRKTLNRQRTKAALLRQVAGRRKKELDVINKEAAKKAAAEAAAKAAAAAAAAKAKPAPKGKAAKKK